MPPRGAEIEPTTGRSTTSIDDAVCRKYAPCANFQRNNHYTHLHVACKSIAPVSDIQVLIQKDDSALLAQESQFGATPLHLALQFYGYNPAVTKTLVDAGPDALKIPDRLGRLPLHIAMEYKASMGSIQSLLEGYPVATELLDTEGRSPLHSGIRHRASEDAIVALVQFNPNAAAIKYKNWTPLQWALSHDLSSMVVKVLIEAYPVSSKLTDSDGRTALHIGMAMRADKNVIKVLLDAYPEAAATLDHDGWTPLRHGIRNKAPESAIQLVRRFSPDLPRTDGRIKKPYEY